MGASGRVAADDFAEPGPQVDEFVADITDPAVEVEVDGDIVVFVCHCCYPHPESAECIVFGDCDNYPDSGRPSPVMSVMPPFYWSVTRRRLVAA